MFSSSLEARIFYGNLIKQHTQIHVSGKMIGHKHLIARVRLTCEKHSFLKYIFDDCYSRVANKQFT